MGTWYTFTTELIHDKDLADAAEKELIEADLRGGYMRHYVGESSYFTGCHKDSGGGFYEVFLDVGMVWISDEGIHNYNEMSQY